MAFYYHITVFTVLLYYYCCINVILLLIYWYFTPIAYCQFTIALLHLVLFTVNTFHNSIVKCWIQKCCDSVAILEDLLTQLYLMFPTWAMTFVYIRFRDCAVAKYLLDHNFLGSRKIEIDYFLTCSVVFALC